MLTRSSIRLRTAVPLILSLAILSSARTGYSAETVKGSSVTQAESPLPSGLEIVYGPVNGAFLKAGGHLLAVYGDPSGRHSPPGAILLTHARRDAIVFAHRSGAQDGASPAPKVIAPESEVDYLIHPENFWADLAHKRFHDYAQQSTKLPIEAIPVARSVKGGDTIAFGDLSIRVLDTPGYTRGAVTYLVQLDGKKIAFTGDLIRGDGKLQDLFSLQDAIPEAKIGGYHGWAGRLGQLMASLESVSNERPDLIVPLRGPIIRDPGASIGRLRSRVKAVYANYLSIDALRWYFKDEHIRAKARRVLGPDSKVDWMPMGETRPLPENVVAISNARLILAADRSGFLIDCGGIGIIDELRKLRAAGKLTTVEDVFVTHYHDDHTDALPKLVSEFGAKVHACGRLVDVLERPGDYRLPCLTKNPVSVTAAHQPGDTWEWKEYRLSIFDFPGQTLYHNAMLLQRDGSEPVLFAGDSFTPTGIDDYCLQNRNFVHEGEGFLRCLDVLEKLPPGCLIVNQHVEPAFRFNSDQIARMRDTLHERIPLLRELFDFDDPNFGLDENWAVFHPYWISLRPGESAPLQLRITNHSPHQRTFATGVYFGHGLNVTSAYPVQIAPHGEGALNLRLHVPNDARPGLHVVTADVTSDNIDLREWAEVVIEVRP